ncbi:MAG: N(4)-(beta-N-acetylglucosaminyl)-L-asparaginase [Planctomycetes bacterium]|nr:N(4)-(beta-N-acetylglucosaminyl)-L-asparaginase [Planctomycetota bacterium]MCP4770399.1 N(4)-(beta-N-acetylglucosaminyl)-L-asparaginase [Planctomycetota bacterium]MCP4860509.1 N(4)-(beta-N-acetylglucosaminyl)-L-asparaginase [Planctomycetota bacterium]
MSRISRRRFLCVAGAGVAASTLPQVSQAAVAAATQPLHADTANPCVAISSANGIESVAVARGLVLEKGMRPVSAAVQGVASVEADPNDMSVGYGGLPNELGKVQLDSACMDGPTHNAGSVASIEDIMHPAQVAELVMDRTDHINLVGPGARQFALDYGFKAEDLLTERARQIWLKWRSKRSGDDYLWPLLDTEPADPALADEPRPWGTIHCSVLAPSSDVGCCTTTSGLAFKIPGRIGDSPLIGCGLYCDNEVGSAGATGRGEAAILSGGSWLVVERMRAGDTPEQACLYALKRVAEQAERGSRWQPALWKDGQPNFGLTFYAVRKDGLYGSASMRGAGRFAVADAKGARLENCAIAFGNK